ncbi:MAG: DUF3772 domain-containing protein [Hyphomicrobiales bacterium]
MTVTRAAGRFVTLVVSCLLAWLTVAPAFAQQLVNPLDDIASRAERDVGTFRGTLQQANTTAARPAVANEDLASTRADVERVRIDAAIAADKLAAPLADLQAQLKKLPPPPAKDGTEPQSLANERARLSGLIDRLTAVRSQLSLVSVEAEQLASKVATVQRDRFVQRIFEPSRSILNPQLWSLGLAGAGVFADRLTGLFKAWYAQAQQTYDWPILIMLVTCAIVAAVAFAIVTWVLKLSNPDGAPDDVIRTWRATLSVVVSVAITVIAVEWLWTVLDRFGLMVGRLDRVYDAADNGIFTMVTFWTFAVAVFRPNAPHWRMVALDDRTAASNATLLTIAGIIIGFGKFFYDMAAVLFVPVETNHLWAGFSAVSLIVIASAMLLTLQPVENEEHAVQRSALAWVRPFAPFFWIALAVATLALLLGYIALGDFITAKLFEAAVIISFLVLIHHLADATVAASLDQKSPVAALLRERLNFTKRGIERLGITVSTATDLLLVIGGFPLLVFVLSLNWISYGNVASAFFTGFQVGDVLVTPWSIVLALLIFLAGLVLMRIIYYWLDRRVLSRASFDDGLRNSILTATRYLLTGGAAVFAATAAGLDFSNLALVAGALSVGIGFGLQSIVNNFVSGLILLAERPIKVGDWVIVSGGEGIVKRINVRSTEIETFDRASVIVPNSSLISDTVKNRTHADRLGRAMVAVGVDYNSNPIRVADILTEIGRAHPACLPMPLPIVRFVDFGDYSLNFVLYVYIGEVSDVAQVESDIRFEIYRRFAEENIIIPSPLREITATEHARARRAAKKLS